MYCDEYEDDLIVQFDLFLKTGDAFHLKSLILGENDIVPSAAARYIFESLIDDRINQKPTPTRISKHLDNAVPKIIYQMAAGVKKSKAVDVVAKILNVDAKNLLRDFNDYLHLIVAIHGVDEKTIFRDQKFELLDPQTTSPNMYEACEKISSDAIEKYKKRKAKVVWYNYPISEIMRAANDGLCMIDDDAALECIEGELFCYKEELSNKEKLARYRNVIKTTWENWV